MITKKKTYLRNLAEILSGVYEKTDPDGEIAYLQTKDCTDEVIIKYASRVLLTAKMQKNLLQEGDILFASKGVNYLSVVFREQEKTVASTSFFVIRLKSPVVTPEYLCWFLRQPSIKAYFKSNQAGSATIIRKSKFPQNPKRSVRFSGKRTKRSVQKRKARNTQKAETKVL